MTDPQILMWAAVFAVAVSFFYGMNATAGALVISWLTGEAIYRITGDSLPVDFYIFPDIFVIAVIFAKGEYCTQYPYETLWHQVKCIVLERSPCDRIVMLIYPIQWAFYVSTLHPYYKWWALFYLVLVQFLAAGFESFQTYRRHAEAVIRKPDPPGTLLVAYLTGGRVG